MPKTYDRDYFDKWYRDPQHAVGSPAELRRKVAMVVAQAEYYLARPIRNVLDVGCGEATWRAPLRALRPDIAYRGLDASEYVVARYGRSRNIGLARFGQLEQLRFDTRFDLIVCTDVLHYLRPSDDVAGDHHGFISRAPAWYLREFGEVGLLPCGSHCYLGPRLERHIAALERAQLPV